MLLLVTPGPGAVPGSGPADGEGRGWGIEVEVLRTSSGNSDYPCWVKQEVPILAVFSPTAV